MATHSILDLGRTSPRYRAQLSSCSTNESSDCSSKSLSIDAMSIDSPNVSILSFLKLGNWYNVFPLTPAGYEPIDQYCPRLLNHEETDHIPGVLRLARLLPPLINGANSPVGTGQRAYYTRE